ncbi:MAG: DNA-3-methyladenine glycosylase I [Alphaproteobacteria bacterium]|nr:DNA-3-methyladenine glycosylase I [Alphaproteobacteria bacterium]
MPQIAEGLLQSDDKKIRCKWHGNDSDYLKYHDTEWGYPVSDDRHLFEKISLEGFQAGLSWLTILRKRDKFRKAFDNFDYIKIAKYNEKKILHLLDDQGIIRHRGKIEATINNAQKARDLIDEFGSLAAYFWRFEPEVSARPKKMTAKILFSLAQTKESQAMSKDLKKRGWKFVGPTTCYAFMQSMGIVNDHIEGCFCRPICDRERKKFKKPF